MHKPEKPLRPISQGYASLANETEKFLNEMLSPLQKLCEYLIDDPKAFKTQFLPYTENFDHSKYTLVSFDAIKLFTNVDIDKVIDFCLKQIFCLKQVYSLKRIFHRPKKYRTLLKNSES